jgi:hypothetical protein
MCALPTATYDPTKTVVGRQCIVSLTIAAASTHFLAQVASYDPTVELGRLLAPGASNGPAFTARVWQKAVAEVFKFETEEVEKVRSLLGSFVGLKTGTCTIYIRDPEDAAATVAYKSDDFACAIYRDPATISFGGDNPAKVMLVMESLKDGAIAWDDDASTA